jgi:MOSC domain-containing protein
MSGRRQIGTVQALWRYPVKSLAGEELQEAAIGEYGIEGDRRWALRELERGGIMSARVWSGLLGLRARYREGGRVEIELDGEKLEVEEQAATERLSQHLGRRVQIERVRRERPSQAEIEAVIRGEAFPPARDFFDEDVIHIIANGTLEHLRTLNPAGDFDRRRFRANIYIDTGAERDGFIEDRWLDGELRVGESVRIAGLRPAIRCVMTTHQQPGLPRDMSILRTAAQHHGAYVGVFASIAAGGQVRVGDTVILEA